MSKDLGWGLSRAWVRVAGEGSPAACQPSSCSLNSWFVHQSNPGLSQLTDVALRQNRTGDPRLKTLCCGLWLFRCSLTTSSGTQGWRREKVDRRKHTSWILLPIHQSHKPAVGQEIDLTALPLQGDFCCHNCCGHTGKSFDVYTWFMIFEYDDRKLMSMV